ncbi:mCG145624, partial [Mus musculus]
NHSKCWPSAANFGGGISENDSHCLSIHQSMLQGTWIQFLAPTWRFMNTYNSSSKRSNILFWPLKHSHKIKCPVQHECRP